MDPGRSRAGGVEPMRVLAAASALATLALASGPALAEEPKAGAADEPKQAAAEPAKPATVEAGRKVSIEYTLTLDDGEQADSNVGGQPLVFEQGKHQILPALEKA